MTYLTNTFRYKDQEFTFTWIPSDNYSDLSPITQAYGFCFNKNNKLLVIESSELNTWQVPGGTPELGETPEQALVREIKEEANVTIKNIHYLGAQKVDDGKGIINYQLRFACRINTIDKRQADPDKGKIIPRKFIDPLTYSKVSKWGEIGQDITERAMKKLNIKR